MIVLRTKITEQRPLDVARDAWRAITRKAHYVVGQYWLQNYFPLHFRDDARTKYGYKPRSKRYRQRKEQQGAKGRPWSKYGLPVILGGRVDNVLTGEMMRATKNTNSVRGYPSRTTVMLYGPAYLSTRFRKKNQPDKGAELTRVRADEARALSALLVQEITAGIEANRALRTTEP